MGLQRWLRDRARRSVDSLFCSSSPYVQRIGDEETGWVIHTDPMPKVCYCAGVGKGISFELALAHRVVHPVVVLDPSPTGIATIAATRHEAGADNLAFFPIGIAARTGVIEFSVPKDAGEGSYSLPREVIEKVSFECWDLSSIMDRQGDSAIDLLKMDIEGFEYDVVDQILDQRIPIRQLCIEFHAWLAPGRTLRTIRRLYSAGYRIVHKRRGDHTFLKA